METYNVSCCSREWMEGQREDNDPRKTTAEGSRHASDTSQQPSAYRDQTSTLKESSEMMKEMDNKISKEMFEMMEEMGNKIRTERFKMMEEMDNKIRTERFKIMEEMDNKMRTERFKMVEEMGNKIGKEMYEIMEEMGNKIRTERFKIMEEMDNKIIENRTLTDPVNTAVRPPDSCSRAFPGRVIQIQYKEKEENEVLKEKIKKLEARNQELLARAMAMHQHSEDTNDPFRLSAVRHRYEMLQLQQWEKVRSSKYYGWTYEQGSEIIRKLFDACEKDMQQKTDDILKALDIPPQSSASIESKQEMMQEIRKLFRQPYYQKYSLVYNKIIQKAAILTGNENQTEKRFLLECCQIYCLLLLQHPPVKAEWNMDGRYLEHVDKKDAVHWKNPSLLWPIMKCGEEVIAKGVVWDQNNALGFKRRLT